VPRSGETSQHRFRNERLFAVGHRWYFATREGDDIGPFRDRQAAELALAVFVARRVEEQASSGAHQQERKPGKTAFEAMVDELVSFFEQRRQRSVTGADVWALRRIQTLRSRADPDSHAQARAAALDHLLGEVEQHGGKPFTWAT
jgi:hypothetical protein